MRKDGQSRAFEKLNDRIRERKAKEKRYQTYSCNSFKTFRRCNECGNIYDKRDNNEGWCPFCRLEAKLFECAMEAQHRREESA